MYVIDHRVDELHFDDRAVDALFEQTPSFVLITNRLLAVFGGGDIWCFAEDEFLRKYLFEIISIGNIHEITSFSNWIYVFHS